ncbi:MAG: proton-conducting transporter membrane subunit [bacterium]
MVILGIACHALSGVPGLFIRRDPDAGQRLAAGLCVIGSALGIAGSMSALWFPPTLSQVVRLDGIAVIFLIPIFLVSGLGSIYGLEYWTQAAHPGNGRKLRLFYGLVTAGLAGLAIAANSILFLVAWEAMTISAYFLVTTEDENPEARDAGLLYLVVTHVSTLCLFAIFAVWRVTSGSFALGPLPEGAVTPAMATGLFLLGVVAFGLKAGLMPFHIWLPSAHAMAPSHVSALMSGVLIKIGIYGLIRLVSWLPDPPVWWGGLLLALGTLSGVLGVVFALGQHDLKRLLAYHSIENIGIIVMGLGLALVGRSLDISAWIVLGLGGALLHVWNHGLFKALLFLSAGSVIHATHTRVIDQLGGLARTMPRTALYFAVGAVAICGLPPLNGFVSELLIYLGLFRTLGIGQGPSWAGAACVAPMLALIGALALACFVKAFGSVFLGVARSESASHAHEAGARMTGPMMVLAACCLFIGLLPRVVTPVLEQGIAAWAPGGAVALPALRTLAPLGWVSLGGFALVGLLALLGLGLALRIRRSRTVAAGTWDCGYAAPAATMQYTSSSFAQMLGVFFVWVLRPQVHTPGEQTLFPSRMHFRSHVMDVVLDEVLRPAYRIATKIASWCHFFQAGNIHAYLFYIVLFLIALLLWR